MPAWHRASGMAVRSQGWHKQKEVQTMRISSATNSDWYRQLYAQSLGRTTATLQTNTAVTDTSGTEETATVQSGTKRQGQDDMSLMRMLFANGGSRRATLQSEGTGSTERAAAMEQMKTDMDALKEKDVGTLSADEMKSTLTQLLNDRAALSPDASTTSNTSARALEKLNGMSESDMREMLQNIQERAQRVSERSENGTANGLDQGYGMPPPPPDMFPGMNGETGRDTGSDASQYGGISSVNLGLTALSSDASTVENAVASIMDQFTAAWQNASADSSTSGTASDLTGTTGSTSSLSLTDFLDQLKNSLTSLFTRQKESLDSFSSLLLSQLGSWGTGQATDETSATDSSETGDTTVETGSEAGNLTI